MTTQKELFEQLKNRSAAASSGEREAFPPFVRFEVQGDVIQGVVLDTYVTKAYDPSTKSAAKDKNGNEVPQLNVTLELNHDGGIVKGEDGRNRQAKAGEKVRQAFANDLLWKLGGALGELGIDELPVGAVVASKWEGQFNGGRAREHAVIVKVGE